MRREDLPRQAVWENSLTIQLTHRMIDNRCRMGDGRRQGKILQWDHELSHFWVSKYDFWPKQKTAPKKVGTVMLMSLSSGDWNKHFVTVYWYLHSCWQHIGIGQVDGEREGPDRAGSHLHFSVIEWLVVANVISIHAVLFLCEAWVTVRFCTLKVDLRDEHSNLLQFSRVEIASWMNFYFNSCSSFFLLVCARGWQYGSAFVESGS